MLKWSWIAVLVIVFDQLTKYIASSKLLMHKPVEVFPMFNWTLMHNKGAAFSFLHDAGGWQRWFFSAIAIIVSAAIIYWVHQLKQHEKWQAVALLLILGGAIGNLVDRIWLGYVVDFIEVYYQNYYWPAFNIADSAIFIGVVMIIIDAFREYRNEKANKQEN